MTANPFFDPSDIISAPNPAAAASSSTSTSSGSLSSGSLSSISEEKHRQNQKKNSGSRTSSIRLVNHQQQQQQQEYRHQQPQQPQQQQQRHSVQFADAPTSPPSLSYPYFASPNLSTNMTLQTSSISGGGGGGNVNNNNGNVANPYATVVQQQGIPVGPATMNTNTSSGTGILQNDKAGVVSPGRTAFSRTMTK